MELYRRGLVVYTWGNASEREGDIAAIKPSGVPYETMTPDDIVVLSISTGEKLYGSMRPSSDWPTHRELFKAYPEIGGVTHTHSTYATSFAQAAMPIKCLGTTHADYFFGEVPCTRYIDKEEVENYERDTGRLIASTVGSDVMYTPAVLVAGHGPFTWGKDAQESVYHAVVLEEVAKMASITYSLAPGCAGLPEHIMNKHFMRKHGPNAYYGQTKTEK